MERKRRWGLTVKLAEGGVELVEIEMGVVIDVIVGQHVRQGTLFGQLRKMFILKRLYRGEREMKKNNNNRQNRKKKKKKDSVPHFNHL
jgi:hypothetical protein